MSLSMPVPEPLPPCGLSPTLVWANEWLAYVQKQEMLAEGRSHTVLSQETGQSRQ